MTPLDLFTDPRPWRRRWVPILIALLAVAWPAVAKPSKEEVRELKREGITDIPGTNPSKRDDNAEARGTKPNASDAEARALAKLRERLEVTDDAEWAVISERITKVEEMRRQIWAAGAAGRGAPSPGDKVKRSNRPGASAHPEQDALRSAVIDKLPDAEIKARLARVHEVHQQNEARLFKAQADLRAVLTIRQEAVAVMAGLLPP